MIEKKHGERLIAEITLSHLSRRGNSGAVLCPANRLSRFHQKGFQNGLPQWCDR